jgi:hypothetical protein
MPKINRNDLSIDKIKKKQQVIIERINELKDDAQDRDGDESKDEARGERE